MKFFKVLMLLIIVSIVAISCEQEEDFTNQDIKSLDYNSSNRAPGPSFENYNLYCGNGPQVKLLFSDCNYSPLFYINVFESNQWVFSWTISNPNYSESVVTSIGSSPFTDIYGNHQCSLLHQGNNYTFSITYVSDMDPAAANNSFSIPSNYSCWCVR